MGGIECFWHSSVFLHGVVGCPHRAAAYTVFESSVDITLVQFQPSHLIFDFRYSRSRFRDSPAPVVVESSQLFAINSVDGMLITHIYPPNLGVPLKSLAAPHGKFVCSKSSISFYHTAYRHARHLQETTGVRITCLEWEEVDVHLELKGQSAVDRTELKSYSSCYCRKYSPLRISVLANIIICQKIVQNG